MPDPIEPKPSAEEGKLRARVAALEAAVTYLMKGAKRVSKEIDDEWGELTYEPGEHFGVRIEA